MSRLQASLLVLLAACIWGVAFYFQKTAMNNLGPLTFFGLRGLVAAIVLAPFAWREARAAAPGSPSILRFAGLGGLVFFVAGAVQQFGIVTATVTNTGFLTSLYVVVTPFLFWLLRKERPEAVVWIAAAIAAAGIWALGGGTLSAFSHGDMLIAASAIGWSLYMVVTSMAGKLGKPLQYTCLHFIVVAALGLGGAALFETISWEAIKAAGVPVLYVGVLSSALTFGLLAIAVRHIPATHASILVSTETLFGAAAGHIMLGERLGPISWLGAAMLMSAVLLIQLRRKA